MKAFKKAILFKALAWFGLIAPMVTLLVIKKDVYFIKGETVKMSLGCVLALIFTFVGMKGKLKEMNSILTLGIVWVLCFLLKSLIDDILLIVPCCMGGNMLYMVFNYFFKYYNQIHFIQRNAKLDQVARQEITTTKEIIKTGGIV